VREGFRFFGNVEVGADLTITELRSRYHAVIYAFGAAGDRTMGVPGEQLAASHSATEFVGWYNGHPDFSDRKFDLSARTAVVVGNGNVALDVARMLTAPHDRLASTDIADHALDALASSAIEEVVVIGRRGPAHAAFSAAELAELPELAEVDVVVDPADLRDDAATGGGFTREDPMTRRKLDALARLAAGHRKGLRRRVNLRFRLSPVEIVGPDRVEGIRVRRNELVEDESGMILAVPTDDEEMISAQIVVRAVGYRGVPLDDVPFDQVRGVIPNDSGRVLDEIGGMQRPGEYVCGWIKRGPSGIIGTNKKDSQETIDALLADHAAGLLPEPRHPGPASIVDLLHERAPHHLAYRHWRAIDDHERALGGQSGRPRVKLTSTRELLDIARAARVG
jgi:ferredoxin--NADP+ reductase